MSDGDFDERGGYCATTSNKHLRFAERSNPHFTLKTNPLTRADRNHKASLDIFWLRDETLADSDNLSAPEVIAQEIVEDREAAPQQFRLIAGDLNGGVQAPSAPV